MRRSLLLLATCAGLVSASPQGEDSGHLHLDADDECSASGNEASCALSALQRRGAARAAPGPQTTADAFNASAEPHLGFAPPPHPRGHSYMATTTHYANTATSACGLDTSRLVSGTNYYAVASAQAMQAGGFWCTLNGGGGKTAGMGCGSCARGRFVRRAAQGFGVHLSAHAELFTKEYNIIVADVCPHQGNEHWCPSRAGELNQYGSHNHFDWASPPVNFDNYFFEFTPTECSGEMKARYARMSKCTTDPNAPSHSGGQQHNQGHQDHGDPQHQQHGDGGKHGHHHHHHGAELHHHHHHHHHHHLHAKQHQGAEGAADTPPANKTEAVASA